MNRRLCQLCGKPLVMKPKEWKDMTRRHGSQLVEVKAVVCGSADQRFKHYPAGPAVIVTQEERA